MSNVENLDQAYVLLDIGGTAIKYGIADFEGNLIIREEMPTPYGGPKIVEAVNTIIHNALTQYSSNIKGVSISTAGMVDPDLGKIVYALEDAIPDYTGVNYKELIKDNFNLLCEVENDVNCAALGELWKGAAQGLSSIFCMTIGTSIGGAMICDYKLVAGASNSAGEIAYMRTPNGMLHEIASTNYLVRHYAKLKDIPFDPKTINGIRIFNEAESGDSIAIKAIDDLIDNITDGITNVVSIQNPQAIVLGGGIMARTEYLRPRIEQSLKGKLREIVLNSTRLEFAALKNDAGMLGALYHFKQRNNHF